MFQKREIRVTELKYLSSHRCHEMQKEVRLGLCVPMLHHLSTTLGPTGSLGGTSTWPETSDLRGLEWEDHMPSGLQVLCLFKSRSVPSPVARRAVFPGELIRAYLSSAALQAGYSCLFSPDA